jgi:hypothetical protein
MANIKSKVYEKIVTIIDKFSDRLTKNAIETRQNTEDLAVLRQEYNNSFVRFESTIQEMFETGVSHNGPTINGIKQNIEKVKEENNKREESQTLRDQNNVQSLVNLRELTQKGFDQVRKDVEQLLNLNQRLNERMGKAESLANAAWHQMVGVEQRVAKIEEKMSNPAPAPQMPSDHVWVNKKLSGVYDTTDDLESRVREMEQFLNAFREFQKAASLLSKI